jgi:Mrp family chromosome partitioning ATPase
MSHIEHVVAVMSGKGGVGKSLITALLAVGLARQGQQVGILDADITGPSIPRLFGLQDRPIGMPWGIMPVQSDLGIKIISVNLLLSSEDEAVIWRGPLIDGLIRQFWTEVVWGQLDCLLVDLPPGTADAPLTVMQVLPLDGVVLVTTPQELAAMVVRKALRMAQAMDVPLLGVVENMSYFVCPDTGTRHEIFGPSGAEALARAAGVPLLARLPVDPQISRLCDAGEIEAYDDKAATILVQALAEQVPARKPAPGGEIG